MIHCGSPQQLDHGVLINLTSRYFDGVAYYRCDIGYTMSGVEKVTCLDDGWNDMPACNRKYCKVLEYKVRYP